VASEALGRFLDALGEDKALKAEVDEAMASAADRSAALAGVAVRHGYIVAPADIEAAAAELSEDDLAGVAGGITLSVPSAAYQAGPASLAMQQEAGADAATRLLSQKYR
jgi:hypothetical protein